MDLGLHHLEPQLATARHGPHAQIVKWLKAEYLSASLEMVWMLSNGERSYELQVLSSE